MKSAEKRKNIWEKLRTGRLKEWLTIAGVALLLCISCFFIFNKEKVEESASVSTVYGTETEQRLAALLSEIEGVGEVQVMIGDTEEGEKSVVVVCVGAKNLQVIMDVREAAATAVGTKEKNVKVYIKEN